MTNRKKPKPTPKVIGRILDSVADGGTLREACAREEVSYHSACKTLRNFYRLEYEATKECGIQKLVDMAFQHAMTSTNETATADAMFCGFVMWLAERRLSAEYGTRRTVTVGKGTGFILRGDLLVPEEPNPSIGEYARAGREK